MKNILFIMFLFLLVIKVQPQSSYALQFNGTNQYVSVPYNSAMDIPNGGTLTIECWIYPTGGANIITRDNYGYGLWVGGDNKLYYWDQGAMGSTVPTTGTITFNKWQHIAVTVKDVGSSLSINFYINGIPDAGNPKTSTQAQINNGGGTLDLGIQARSSCGCNFYSGNIDELRIWNVERTPEEIKNNYLTEISASSTGLIAYYKFNNGSGSTLTDATSNGLNGTIYNSSSWIASSANIAVTHPGNALSFVTAQNDYISVPHASQIDFGTSTNFTIEAWIKLNSSVGSYTGIVAKANNGGWYGFQLVIVNNKLAAETRDQSGNIVGVGQGFIGTTPLDDGNWHHVAMVVNRSSTNAKLYVDGEEEANVTNSALGGNLSNTGTMYIGAERSPAGIINGYIDEVRIWNSARSQAELQANKSVGIDPTTSNLVAYYRFDEGISSGTNTGVTTLLDLTSYANNGTLNGFSLSGSLSNWVLANNDALPVELTTFTANVNENEVTLNWQTATEVNNYGFEIERQTVETLRATSNEWETIGFVEGHGNSNSPKDYTFTDNLLNLNLNLTYRLKQLDFDGNYEYSDVVEVTLAENIKEYKLEQNYPNPFNPSTTISYSIPANVKSEMSNVKLIVYDILGNEVATLVNERQKSGNYEVKFGASNLSSGIYLYKLQSGSFVQTRKLMLVK